MYTNLQPRITKALFEAIDPSANKPLTTQYGAVVAITRLGPLCVELLLLPVIDRLTARLSDIIAPGDGGIAASSPSSTPEEASAAAAAASAAVSVSASALVSVSASALVSFSTLTPPSPSSSSAAAFSTSSKKLSDMNKLHEAQQVYAALLHGMALYVRDRHKTAAELDSTANSGSTPQVKKGGAKKRFLAPPPPRPADIDAHRKVAGGDGKYGKHVAAAKRSKKNPDNGVGGLFGEALQPFSNDGGGSLSLVL